MSFYEYKGIQACRGRFQVRGQQVCEKEDIHNDESCSEEIKKACVTLVTFKLYCYMHFFC